MSVLGRKRMRGKKKRFGKGGMSSGCNWSRETEKGDRERRRRSLEKGGMSSKCVRLRRQGSERGIELNERGRLVRILHLVPPIPLKFRVSNGLPTHYQFKLMDLLNDF